MSTAPSTQPKLNINVVVDNHWARFRCPPQVLSMLKEEFSYRDPRASYTLAFRQGSWDGMRSLMQYGKVGTGLFYHLQTELERKGYMFAIHSNREPLPLTKPGWDPLTRHYQKQAVVAMAKSNGGLVLMATGVGKTHLSGELLRRLDCPACFVVDELTLLEQSRCALRKITGERIGVIGRGEFSVERLNVATVQTLHRHRDRFSSWCGQVVLVIDEVHVALNRSNIDVVSALKPRAVFGLTATLQVAKLDILYRALAMCGPVLFKYSIEQGQEEGYLTRGLVCQVVVAQRSAGFDREAIYRELVTVSPYRNGCIAALVREGVKRGRRIVVLVERLHHLKVLSRMLNDIPHKQLSGKFSRYKGERIDAAKSMDAGKLPVIIATRVFGKGIDIATVDTIIDATAMASVDNAQQRYGRGVRRAVGKAGLLHFDIADAGNGFARNATARASALQSLGVPSVSLTWEGDAASIYSKALKGLEETK
jgi:superfamily II DNA or RNA helicase